MTEYRVCVCGSGGVGKSAITIRFIQGNFVAKYDPTIEDSYRKATTVDNKACMLAIMDTAGQEEYSSLRDQYLNTGEGFVLVYSVTSLNSFEYINSLHKSITRLKEQPHELPMVLVGNKCDLLDNRVVKIEDGEELAKRNNWGFVESSAKNDINIEKIFHTLVRLIDKWREKPERADQFKKKKPCMLL